MFDKLRKMYFYIILDMVNILLSGTRFFGLKRKLYRSIGIEVGENTKIVGPIKIGRIVKIKIGEECWIGSNLSIYGNGEVDIGDRCDLAPDISIITGSHMIGTSERRAGGGLSYNYKIGSGTWIGTRATLINGINIGNGVVIGACSLINKSCDDNAIYAGCPANKIRQMQGGE